ncbi:hypothetical protein [Pseudomonas putida]|uniref:hypothetical protein n=1 Tax=Pseudomonas putida TaxID=303 RepID=UPI00081914C0|nr:hypothetical protein [Pseudomonas putida]OCT25798.1 hypothetical protein A6E24_11890 [Pseudomonas putida]OCT27721.1 hypothetical protein A6E23_08325 [Pseudomonas putida]OCT32220.1 hypothetical protein A6E20_01115 [Pseudomonas putida]OCT38910.1 hypothetical protein A6E19_11385 [Pseudomonas putida]
MMISLNGLGWQTALQQPSRVNHDAMQADFMPQRQAMTTSNTAAQQNNQGSTSQQNAEDARQEAFAKLKVALQNPDIGARQQASSAKPAASNALQEFRDYMSKSPAEKIKEKILQELGMTEEDYNALPPEKKQKIDEQIAQRMKEDVELKTQAKLQQQAERAAANTADMTQGSETSKQQEDKEKAQAV